MSPHEHSRLQTHTPALYALAGIVTKEEDIGPVEMVALEGDNISDSTIEAYTDKFSPESILTDKQKLCHTIRRTSPKIDTDDKVLFCPIRNIIAISEPISVKSIDNTLVCEIPFGRVEDRIDRESEDNDVLTKIKSIVEKEEHN